METIEKKEAKAPIISYWNKNTELYPTYSKLWDANVPDSGEASTNDGESIRAIGRLLYEWCNNGNCNAAEMQTESCSECGGSGYEDADECYECNGSGEDDEGGVCYNCEGVGEQEADDCYYCGGECYVDAGRILNDYYADMLNHVENNVPDISDEVKAVKELILGDKNYNYDFDQKESDIYNALMDKVVKHVMKNPKNFDTKNKDKKDEKVEVIKEGYRKSTEDEIKAMKYLNDLRRGGTINMFGARPHVASYMDVDKKESSRLLKLWMDNFNDEGNYSQVKI